MAIEFSCSSCQKNYRVKDKLAGKTVECTACSAKMRIPELVSAASESGLNLGDLIDDQLPTKESATLTPAVTSRCKECGAPITLDAVICVACGFDKRVGDVLETESEKALEEGEARSTSDFLKRGGAFSFLGAMLAAAAWLGLAIVADVGVKVGYPAMLVGILAGMGMARGYSQGQGKEKEAPNFFAGAIASVMSLAGIFAAKGLIFDHFRGVPEVVVEKGKALEEVAERISFESMTDMFGFFDILFILVAVAAAYALARGDHAMDTENDTA